MIFIIWKMKKNNQLVEESINVELINEKQKECSLNLQGFKLKQPQHDGRISDECVSTESFFQNNGGPQGLC